MPKFQIRSFASSRSLWALVDQSAVSAGNFITSLLLARHLPAADFGVFVLLNAIYQVLFGLQGNLIIAPFMVLASSGSQEKTRSQLTSALIFSVLVVAPFSLVMLAASASLHQVRTGWFALLYLAFWQLQETTRRALSTKFRYAESLIGDSVSYLVQAALLAVFLSRTKLSLNGAFLLMAATSAAALLIQLFQVGVSRVSLHELAEHGRGFWKLGKWLAVVSLTTIAIAPISTWLLNFFEGKVAAAVFQAIMNVVGVANPVILSLPSLVIPLIASRFTEHGGGTAAWAISQARRFTLTVWLLLAPLYLFLLIAPATALRWFYGSSSLYAHQTTGLRIAVVISAVTIPLIIYNAVFTGMGLTRENASMNGMGALVSILLSPPCAYFGGPTGALAAECVSRTARVGWAYRRLHGRAAVTEAPSQEVVREP